MTPRDTSRGVGKDRTDWRRHRTTAIGGKITRTKLDPASLIEISLVKLCCPDTPPGKMCYHGVWTQKKVERP